MKSSLLLLLPLFVSGCVLKATHDETIAQQLNCDVALQQAKKESADSQRRAKEAQEKMAQVDLRNEELSQTNQILVQKNKEYVDRSLGLQQEVLRVKDEKAKTEEKISFAQQTYDDLIKTLKKEITEGQVKIAQTGDRLTVNVANQILFPSGSDQIQGEGQGVLKKVAQVLEKVSDKRIVVEGHTDNVRIHGALSKRFPSNWELSSARAIKVVRFLEGNGVDPARLYASGAGEHHPVASNETAEGRQKNRRIEIVLYPLALP